LAKVRKDAGFWVMELRKIRGQVKKTENQPPMEKASS
jgi:hypothetical protein